MRQGMDISIQNLTTATQAPAIVGGRVLEEIMTKSRDPIVEAGPGSYGGIAARTLELGGSYVGLDIDRKAVEESRRMVLGARFELADPVVWLDENPGRFTVVSMNVLDRVHESRAGHRYLRAFADAITKHAEPGSVSYHFIRNPYPHVPGEAFIEELEEHGWEIIKEPRVDPTDILATSALLQYDP